MESQSLLIRADAGFAMGTGHVMRCLALAQAWRDSGGQATFAMNEIPPSLQERLKREDFEVLSVAGPAGGADDAQKTAELACRVGAEWIACDGYQFGTDYQRAIKSVRKKLLFLDDYGHAEHYFADLILNQNLGVRPEIYARRERHTRLLLGPRYALLRREFARCHDRRREIRETATKVLITMGGSDPKHGTEFVLQALAGAGLKDFELTIIVGASNPHLQSVSGTVSTVGIHAEVVHNPSNIVELLAGSDLVITGAGTTCWELCLLGVPSILIELAPNQHGLAQALHEAGAALYVGKMEEIEPADLAHIVRSAASSQVVRRELSDVGRLLLDGQGASRVAAYLKNPLQLRQIGDADCKLLWEWANDPQARRMSFSRSPIPWDTHIRWFKEKMSDPGTMFLMSYREDDTPVGEVRYELDGDRAVVSINISPKFRGNGYGKHTLLLATEELFQRCSSANVIDAFVKPDNKISLQLFESAGFHLEGLRTLGGQEAVHYVLPKRVI